MMETETRTADRAGTAAKETVRTETRAVTDRERIRTVRGMGREAGMVRAIAVLEALVVLARALGGLARIAAGLRAATAGRDNKFRKPAAGKGFAAEVPAKDAEKRRDDRRQSQQDRDRKSKKGCDL